MLRGRYENISECNNPKPLATLPLLLGSQVIVDSQFDVMAWLVVGANNQALLKESTERVVGAWKTLHPPHLIFLHAPSFLEDAIKDSAIDLSVPERKGVDSNSMA